MKKLLLIMAAAMCLVACDDNDHHGLGDDFIDEFKDVDPETLAVLESGKQFNEVIKRFVDDSRTYSTTDTDVQEIVFVPESDLTTGELVSASDSPYPIYASYDEVSRTAYVTTPSLGIKVMDAQYMFYEFRGLKRLDLSKLYMAECTTMHYMFRYCMRLDSLDLRSFNTEKVRDMRGLFYDCQALTSLNVSRLNTENVTDMGFMFSNCESLSSLDISHFNTARVKDMCAMFQCCEVLEQLDVTHFKTDSVWYMDFMFGNCNALKALNLSRFNTQNVIDMRSMFTGCSGLENLVFGSKFKVCDRKSGMFWRVGFNSEACNIVCTQAVKEALSDSITKLDTEKIKWSIL